MKWSPGPFHKRLSQDKGSGAVGIWVEAEAFVPRSRDNVKLPAEPDDDAEEGVVTVVVLDIMSIHLKTLGYRIAVVKG